MVRALAAAALVGVAAASPLVVFAQAQDKPQADDKKKNDEKKDRDEPKDEDKDRTPTRAKDTGRQGLRPRMAIEVRECPQCGHNMYRQGRTWTCENCGYPTSNSSLVASP